MKSKTILVFVYQISLVFILFSKHTVKCSDVPTDAAESDSQNQRRTDTGEVVSRRTREFSEENSMTETTANVKAKRIVKRDAHDIESRLKCSKVHAEGGPGVQVIRDVTSHTYVFFLRPKADFRRIIFNMIIDNNFNINGQYISSGDVAFSEDDLKDVATEDAWLEFQVEYFKHEVRRGRDKLSLKVTSGNQTRSLITPRWWRTHTYMGFRVSVEGGADFIFDCKSQNLVHLSPQSAVNKPLLLGSLFGACFLVVVVGCILHLVFRQPRRQNNSDQQQPPIPSLPASLLLGWNKVNKSSNVDHIYEEFDDDTLARLREKMSPSNLGAKGDGQDDNLKKAATSENDYAVPRQVQLRPSSRHERLPPVEETAKVANSAFRPDPIYLNEMNMTLIEEKIKVRPTCRDSVPESHYVEMHGIIRRQFDNGDMENGK